MQFMHLENEPMCLPVALHAPIMREWDDFQPPGRIMFFDLRMG